MINHDLILTIVNRGFADEVMTAAKKAGAFGGTVVNARGTGTNELQEFFSGCFACSQASKGPIVPVVVYDSYKSMNSNTFEKVTTQVHYLPPIYYTEYQGMKKPEICELVKSRISTKLEEIKNCERGKKVI